MPDDLREIPNYPLAEAAHYLRMPARTLKHWLLGNSYPTKSGTRYSDALIKVAGKDPILLSFFNLVEASILSALRRKYDVKMGNVRKVLDYLESKYPSPHPLADHKFKTDGIDVFIDEYGELESISQQGQIAMRDLLLGYLHRIEWDKQKFAVRLYPYTRDREPDDARLIVIDPRVSFGRPVIAGSGIATSIIAERFAAGESFEDLMDDYDRTAQEIEEALRCELRQTAA